MPRTNLETTQEKNIEAMVREALFTKGGIALNISQIARKIDVRPRTLCNHKENLSNLSFIEGLRVTKAIGMSDDDLLKLRRKL